jgi:sugar-specific transcriptional regulator TrmB
MNKSNRIRSEVARHETVFPGEVAIKVGCTQPLVYQVINAMKDEGRHFVHQQTGGRNSYRLMTDAETKQHEENLDRLRKRLERKRDLKEVAGLMVEMRDLLDRAQARLDDLAA